MSLEKETVFLYWDWAFTSPEPINVPLNTTKGFIACVICLVLLASNFLLLLLFFVFFSCQNSNSNEKDKPNKTKEIKYTASVWV